MLRTLVRRSDMFWGGGTWWRRPRRLVRLTERGCGGEILVGHLIDDDSVRAGPPRMVNDPASSMASISAAKASAVGAARSTPAVSAMKTRDTCLPPTR